MRPINNAHYKREKLSLSSASNKDFVLHTYQSIYGYIKQANVVQQYSIWLCWEWNNIEGKYEDKIEVKSAVQRWF